MFKLDNIIGKSFRNSSHISAKVVSGLLDTEYWNTIFVNPEYQLDSSFIGTVTTTLLDSVSKSKFSSKSFELTRTNSYGFGPASVSNDEWSTSIQDTIKQRPITFVDKTNGSGSYWTCGVTTYSQGIPEAHINGTLYCVNNDHGNTLRNRLGGLRPTRLHKHFKWR